MNASTKKEFLESIDISRNSKACGDRIWTCLAHLEIWSSALPLCVLSAELPISRLHHLPSSATGSGRCCSPGNPSVAGHKKRYKIFSCISLFDCGDRIWTCDLRVMSPTSYRTALLRGSIKWAEKDSNLRSYRNRFTVCPLWPLGNPPTVVKLFFVYELPTHDALGIVQGSE